MANLPNRSDCRDGIRQGGMGRTMLPGPVAKQNSLSFLQGSPEGRSKTELKQVFPLHVSRNCWEVQTPTQPISLHWWLPHGLFPPSLGSQQQQITLELPHSFVEHPFSSYGSCYPIFPEGTQLRAAFPSFVEGMLLTKSYQPLRHHFLI